RLDSASARPRLHNPTRLGPQSGLAGKFSVQYCLARALTDRAIRIEHFEGDAWSDASVRAVLPRVHAAPYTTAQFPEDNHYGAEVKVTTTDGTVVVGKIDEAAGRTSGKPLARERLREKFDNCVARALPRSRAPALADMIERLDTVADVRSFTGLLDPTPAEQTRRVG